MNKLEERFEEVIWESNPNASMMGDLSSNYLVSGFAKEAKDIAIEFARNIDSIMNKQDFNVIMTFEEMFEIFIEEKYGE